MFSLIMASRMVGVSTVPMSRLSTSTPRSFHSAHNDSPRFSANPLVAVYIASFRIPPNAAWEPTNNNPPRPRSSMAAPKTWLHCITVRQLRRSKAPQSPAEVSRKRVM
ncbi:hypothetical protein D3C78_1567580 [compost metagenome]